MTQSGTEGGQVYTKLASVFTSNPFKAVLPMSDENKTDNPYQAPTLSDEPLVRKGADGPKTRLNRVHWLVPILGYAYVPSFFTFAILSEYTNWLGQDGIAETLESICAFFWNGILILLPIYLVVILFLGWRRHRQGTNTTGMNLYHGLSLIAHLAVCTQTQFGNVRLIGINT